MSTQTFSNQVEEGTYVVDPVHSSVTFAVRHNGLSTFRGGFAGYEARLLGGDEPRLEGIVDVAGIEVADDGLKGHLLSPTFFDADRHPTLRFASSEVELGGDGSVVVRGEMEIKGRTHRVEAAGRLATLGDRSSGGRRVGLSLEATIDRRSFGLDWNAELPSGGEVLDYDVQIAVELQFVEQEA